MPTFGSLMSCYSALQQLIELTTDKFHFKLYRHPTPSKVHPNHTPPTPYPHLLALGLPSAFAY
jgi:hypothetical protein